VRAADAQRYTSIMVHDGEKYRNTQPLDVGVLTAWAAPATGGSRATLPAGQIFTVANDPPLGATAVYCNLDNYEALHSHFVIESERKDPKYRGYYLSIRLADIADKCERVLGSVDV
jgi:hypothetical protein